MHVILTSPTSRRTSDQVLTRFDLELVFQEVPFQSKTPEWRWRRIGGKKKVLQILIGGGDSAED